MLNTFTFEEQRGNKTVTGLPLQDFQIGKPKYNYYSNLSSNNTQEIFKSPAFRKAKKREKKL